MQVPSYVTSHKSQISNHNFANLKLQITKKEGIRGKLVTNGNEGIKLNEAINEAKDAEEDAEEADEADVNKEEAKKRQRMPKKKPKML